jgi:heme-degrading monooxygenase HmoA
MAGGDLARTPESSYYAVIFTSRRAGTGDGYDEMAARMEALASGQPGFLGIESVRGPDGLGITVSYWDSLEAIRRWREHPEHLEAQRRGKSEWYADYRLRVAEVRYGYGKAVVDDE